MATDVELSLKHTIMDQSLKDPAACNSSKKVKRIFDFFSSTPRTSASGVLKEVEVTVTEHAEKTFHPHEVHCEKESKSSFENDRGETVGNMFQNTETCVAGDSKKSLNTLMDVLPVESEPNVPSPAESCNLQKPTVMKRKRLATNNKAKGQIGNGEPGPEKEQKRRLATNKKAKGKLENNEARAEKEQKGEPENCLLKNIPQEIDYEEFMKTFAQTPCLNKNSTTAGDEKREEPTDLAGAAVDFIRNRTEEKAAETELAVNKKQTEDYPSTSPILESGCHVGEPGLAKPKASNTANAFSLLMQAKTDRKKERSSESGCHCIKAKDTPSPKQSSVRDISFTDDDEGDSDQPDEVPLEKVSCSSGSSCTPSVLNFFSKCAKGTKIERDGRPVLVKVDIHCDPEKRQIASHKGKSNRDQKIKVGKVGTTDNDSEIVFLGSETIEINEFEGKKLKLRKSKGSSSACIDLSQETFDGVIKEKTNKSEQSVDARRKKFLQDSTPPPDKLVKKAQATLQFAESGGLAMNTSVIAKPAKKYGKKDKEAVDSSETAHLVNSKKSKTRNRSKRQRMSPACDSDSEDVQLVSIEKGRKSSTEETTSAVKSTGKKMLTRLRKSQESESGTAESDAKDFTPRSKCVKLNASASKSRAQELLQKAKQQKSKRSKKKRPQTHMTERNTSNGRSKTHKPERKPLSRAARGQPEEDLIVEAESSTPEQGSRRQSRRLVEQQKMRQEAEQQSCISVDSDSCSDESQTPQKKRSAKRRDSSQASPKRVSSRQNSKHPVGKLAPIFAKKKPGEPLNNAPEQPSEDPEVTRKRREFLMSGVPSELKRQAACAAPAVIATDYAPFPDISHVQQRSSMESGGLDMWSLAAPKNIRGILEEKDKLTEMAALDLKWTSLQWQPTVVEHNKSSLQLLDPPSSDDIDADVCETLLKGLQQTNPTFPFAAMHSKFKAQLSGSTPKKSSSPDDSATVNSAAGTDSDVVIIDDLADTMSQNDKDSQWPEMLQPKSSSEMIGNESSIRRLKFWLEEWKALIQREARLSARSAAVGSDSDFDFSGDDSSEDCSQLCNTMLLVGPHGVGKTAAVYALAHQLSYKVFEVNASSSRQGRHILAQLQEATQSHQVAQKKDGIIFSPSSLTPSRQRSQPTEQPDAKKAAKKGSSAVPNAFASFFKKADTATGSRKSASNSSTKEDSRKNRDSPKKDSKKNRDSPKKDSRKNRDSPKKDSRKNRDSPKEDSAKKNVDSPKNESSRKRRKAADGAEGCRQKRWCGEAQKDNSHTPPGEGEESNLAGYLNLSSTSLILFDEVDLVFEEDSGFLHTVQHFINTTKIPIIMTTSDPGFQCQINARFEALVFKAPSVVSVTSLLQTVCLAAGMRACPDDIGCLAAQCRGDIRHALLTLQFLTLSGGGWNKEPRPVIIGPTQKAVGSEKEPHKGRESLATKSLGLSAAGDENDSDGDFMSLKPLRKKARRIVDDDDDAEDGSSAAASVSAGANTASESERQDGVVVSADRLPLVHLHLHESLLSVSRDLHALFIKCMKGEYNSPAIQLLTTECLKLKNSSLDLLQPNLLKLLPLPKTAMPGRWRPPSEVSSKSVKRKRIRFDIYDSEASDDENTKLTEASECPSADTSNKETAVVTKCDTDAGGEESSAPTEVQHDHAEMLQDESRVETSEANSGLDANVVIVTESGEEKGGETAATAFLEKSICGKEALEADTSLNSSGSSKMDRTEESRVETSEPSRTVQGQMKKSLKGSRKCTDGGLSSKILRSFADYYETLSAVDSSLNNHQQPALAAHIGSGWSLLPGIEDAVSREECKSDQLKEEMKAELGVRASRCLWQSVDHQISSWKCTNSSDQLPDGCSIPVSSSDTSTRLDLRSEAVASSASESYKAVADTIMNILPLTSYTTHGPLTLDYLPTLRAISQAEQCRQLAKVKRRFHHHFDNIGLCLSNSAVTALCAEFPPTQQNA